MNTYYEAFLRRDIFPNNDEKVDLICKLFDESLKDRNYIIYIMEDYINGASVYTTRTRFERNIITKWQRIYEYNAKYLDDEFNNKMKGGD